MVEQKVGYDAFRIEYKTNVSENVLLNDVVSYLGEYRFNLQKYCYDLTFKNGKLRDPHRGEPMETLSQRAIDSKFWEGKSSVREKAEKEGFASLDVQLNSAKDKDTIVWASPPGPKEEGYGDYGFIFIGKVSTQNREEKKISMTAIRVENPSIAQFNKAWHLLTGENTENKTPEEFLRAPRVLNEKLEEGYVDALLGISFDFKPKKEEEEKFLKIIQEMNPLIKDFVNLVRFGSGNEKVKALNVIENYALKLKKDYETNAENVIYVRYENNLRIRDMVGDFGHKPPVARGSCGSSNNTNNLLTRGSILNSLTENQQWFTCPKCSYQADGPVGNQCPGCGLTKEEYTQESGISCD